MKGFIMKKLIFIAAGTYFATRHWGKLSNRDKNKIKAQTRDLISKSSAKAAKELAKYRREMSAHK